MLKLLQRIVFVFFLSVVTTANAQSNYATLSGSVFDPQQQILAVRRPESKAMILCFIERHQRNQYGTSCARQEKSSGEDRFDALQVLQTQQRISIGYKEREQRT